MEYDDSFETWVHELEKVDPCTLFPEFCREKLSSSSSSFDVEISANQKETIDRHQLADQTLYHQTETFSEASLSFSYLDANNMKYNIDEIDAAMNKGQSEGDKWLRNSKKTALPLPQHIIVERRRRRELNQRFLALSKVVPAINKKDRASIVGEAVKYMKDLQERIKKLEEMNKKKVVESVVFVKSSLSSSSSSSPLSSGGSNNQYYHKNCQNNIDDEGDYYNYCNPGYKRRRSVILPEEEEEIEAKVMERSVLIRVHCRNNKNNNYNNQKQEILATLLSSISELHLIVLTANALPFGNHIDITVIAQMGVNFHMKTKDIVDHLRRALPNFI